MRAKAGLPGSLEAVQITGMGKKATVLGIIVIHNLFIGSLYAD